MTGTALGEADATPWEPEPDEATVWDVLLPTKKDQHVTFSEYFLQHREPSGDEVGDGSSPDHNPDQEEEHITPCRSKGAVLASAVDEDPYTQRPLELPCVSTPDVKKRKADQDGGTTNTRTTSSCSQSSVKRRRISKKGPDPSLAKSPLPHWKAQACDLLKLGEVARQKTGVMKTRDLFQRHERKVLKTSQTQKPAELTAMLRDIWNKKSELERAQWLQQCLRFHYGIDLSPDRERKNYIYQKQFDLACKEEDRLMTDDANVVRSKGAMGTWNGSWLDDEDEYVTFLEHNEIDEHMATDLYDLQCVKQLCARFEAFLQQRCEKLDFHHWSYVFEISLNSEDKGRLHMHAFWHTDHQQEGKRIHHGILNAWRFRGSQPNIRPNTGRGRHAQKLLDRGHFYCQCDKIGRVYGNTNYGKYVHFTVEQKWVIGLWQRRKISHDSAKDEIIQARGHTAGYLKEIETVQELENEIAIRKEKKTVDALLDKAFSPFKYVPEVALWRMQYERNTVFGVYGKESRFKFLVLSGPSCMGKTQFAKSLFGSANTLVVPCQGIDKPSLRDYKRYRHKAVLFDEISSQCIHDNKAIFQANNDIVMLGQSPTGQHIYHLFLYGCAIIVSCNDWMQGITPESLEEDWLEKNSIVMQIDKPLYEQ